MAESKGVDNLSKRPVDTDFQQQRLRAWQPLLTPVWVIGSFTVIGVLFFILGGVVLSASSSVVTTDAVRYDNLCEIPVGQTECLANVTIPITSDMSSPVYFYYQLDNFYQNHRRYVKSRSDAQLKGTEGASTDSCDPLESSGGKTLYPCGLIANSKYNDEFLSLTVTSSSGVQTVYDPNPRLADSVSTKFWTNTGIAWKSDRNDKFKNRTITSSETNLSPLTGDNIEIDEELMVWMRTAGLPTFKKLHRIVKSDVPLKAGSKVNLIVRNRFPVKAFEGKKSVLFSTTSWLGGKNEFLAYAYFVVGGICLFLAIVFFIKHKCSPRPLGDMKYFNGNRNWSGPAAAAQS